MHEHERRKGGLMEEDEGRLGPRGLGLGGPPQLAISETPFLSTLSRTSLRRIQVSGAIAGIVKRYG